MDREIQKAGLTHTCAKSSTPHCHPLKDAFSATMQRLMRSLISMNDYGNFLCLGTKFFALTAQREYFVVMRPVNAVVCCSFVFVFDLVI